MSFRERVLDALDIQKKTIKLQVNESFPPVYSLVAASTPTPKDDVWIGKLYKFLDLLALNIGKAKEK